MKRKLFLMFPSSHLFHDKDPMRKIAVILRSSIHCFHFLHPCCSLAFPSWSWDSHIDFILTQMCYQFESGRQPPLLSWCYCVTGYSREKQRKSVSLSSQQVILPLQSICVSVGERKWKAVNVWRSDDWHATFIHDSSSSSSKSCWNALGRQAIKWVDHQNKLLPWFWSHFLPKLFPLFKSHKDSILGIIYIITMSLESDGET